MSLSPAIDGSRFKLLPLYDSLSSNASWSNSAAVRLSNAAYRSLTYFWTKLTTTQCISSWDPKSPEELLFTDSSDFGLGAHLSKPS